MIVTSLANFGDANNNQSQSGATYELSRFPTGWSEKGIDPPASQFPWNQLLGASADLSRTLWAARATEQSINAKDLLLRDADGTLRDLGPVSPPSETEGPPGLGEPATGIVTTTGASENLSHILFLLPAPGNQGESSLLWPGDDTAGENVTSLYEHIGIGSSEPQLVGVKNDGPLASDSEAELVGECGVSPGGPNGRDYEQAISDDGSVVFFTPAGADDNGNPCSNPQPAVDELYARIDAEKTVDISEPILPPGASCTASCAAAAHADATYASVVGSGAQTHLRVSVFGVPASEILGFQGAELTFFGDPLDQVDGVSPGVAFFTNPSACSEEPLAMTLHVDSWEDPGAHGADGAPDFSDPAWKASSNALVPSVGGCEGLSFDPALSFQPDSPVQSAPSGYAVDLHVPQEQIADPVALATPDLKKAVVTLPEGVVVDPSAADGLGACTLAQAGLDTNDPVSCPDASKIGSVEVDTPLIGHALSGSVYLAAQYENPFGTLLAAYVAVDDPLTGVGGKASGEDRS